MITPSEVWSRGTTPCHSLGSSPLGHTRSALNGPICAPSIDVLLYLGLDEFVLGLCASQSMALEKSDPVLDLLAGVGQDRSESAPPPRGAPAPAPARRAAGAFLQVEVARRDEDQLTYGQAPPPPQSEAVARPMDI